MWIAGLRGAMAYALALDSSTPKKRFPTAIDESNIKAGKVMLLQTLIYALFTILIISTFLYPIMLKCEVVSIAKDEEEKEWEDLTPEEIKEATEKELRQKVEIEKQSKNCCVRMKVILKNFDRYYMEPLFIKNIEGEPGTILSEAE